MSDAAARTVPLDAAAVMQADAPGDSSFPSAVPPPTPPVLPAIPGYEILGELGRGGMGVVYKARQVGLDRVVALKMILSGAYAGAEEVQRFKAEAAAVARLQHPHIVQIHEIGEQYGRPFFSLEFCPGGSLDRKLHGTPLPAAEAARLIETLARAVHAAHQQNVIHRDLKPANVLLAADGTPKIADFGLAKKLDEADKTPIGAVLGTPSYMAPEQARGGAVGPAADVYALGAILYECLTGRPPFKAATPVDTVLQVLEIEPVPPRRFQPKTPRDLEIICLKCLQKGPGRRYASAGELADDLGRFSDGRPIRARSISPWGRLTKWARRRPTAAALLAAVLLLMAAGGVAFGLFLKMGADGRNHAAAERARVEKEARDFENVAEDQQRAGRYGDAAAALGKAVELLKGLPDLDAQRERLAARQDLFARLDEFLRDSDRAWSCAGEERGDDVRVACEKALKCFDVLDRADWRTQGPAAQLAPEMAVPVQHEVHRLLLLLAAMRVQQGILCYTRLDWKNVQVRCDEARAVLDRARAMEAEGVVEPSRSAGILAKGAHGLPQLFSVSALLPGTPAPTAAADLSDDLSAEDAFFLGVMHVYLAKHQRDPVSGVVRLLGPREFDYDHPREKAVEMLRSAVRQEPRHYWASFMLGRILAYPGPDGKADYQEAVLAFTNCISLRPDYSRGYEQRGLTEARVAGETAQKAILNSVHADFDKAMALAPDDPSTWWVRGQMFQTLNDVPDSLAAYSRALDMIHDLQDRISWRNQLTDPQRLVDDLLMKNPHDPDALHLAEQLRAVGRR